MDEQKKEWLLSGVKIIFIFVIVVVMLTSTKQQAIDATISKLQMDPNFVLSGFSGASWTCNKYLPELWNCTGNLMTINAMAENNVQCSTLSKAQNYTCFEYGLVKKATAEQIADNNPELSKKSKTNSTI